MATFDINVSVTVTTDAPALDTVGFNVPIFVGITKGFADNEVRFYESASEVADDYADLGEIPKRALDAGFAQNPNCKRMGVADAGEPSNRFAVDWTLVDAGGGTNAGDKFIVTVNGIKVEYTSAGSENETAVAAALDGLLTTALASYPLTVSAAAGVLTINGVAVGDTFVYDYDEVVTGDVSLSTEVESDFLTWNSAMMDAIRSNNDSWYGFCVQTQDATDILAMAAWAETNTKLFLAQTKDADALSGPGDILEDLNDLSYNQTAGCWHSRRDRFFAFSWMAKTFAADPDEVTTIWAYKTLSGIESDKDEVSTTEKNYVLSVEGNLYLPFFGDPVAGMGRVASGQPIDVIITLNWTEARVAEAIAQAFVNYSNRNEKIPYTDVGITIIQAVVEAVMKQGERVGHFTPESTTVTVPALADVTPADKTARLLRLSFVGELAGAIEKATVNGSLVVSL